MSDIDNSLCIRCEWQEEAPHENCKDCADHEAGVCLMAEAYQQGREDEREQYICHDDCVSENCSMCIRWDKLADCYKKE